MEYDRETHLFLRAPENSSDRTSAQNCRKAVLRAL